MKKSELKQIIKEEMEISKKSKTLVFAESTSTGDFENLKVVHSKDIKSVLDINEDGVGICETNYEEFFFIDKLEI